MHLNSSYANPSIDQLKGGLNDFGAMSQMRMMMGLLRMMSTLINNLMGGQGALASGMPKFGHSPSTLFNGFSNFLGSSESGVPGGFPLSSAPISSGTAPTGRYLTTTNKRSLELLSKATSKFRTATATW